MEFISLTCAGPVLPPKIIPRVDDWQEPAPCIPAPLPETISPKSAVPPRFAIVINCIVLRVPEAPPP